MPIPASGSAPAATILTEFAPFQPAPATYNPPSIPANSRLRFLAGTYNPATPSIPTTSTANLPFSVYRGKSGTSAVALYTVTTNAWTAPKTGTAQITLVGGGGGGGLGTFSPTLPNNAGGGGGGGGEVLSLSGVGLVGGVQYSWVIGQGGTWANPNGANGSSTILFGTPAGTRQAIGGSGAVGRTGGAGGTGGGGTAGGAGGSGPGGVIGPTMGANRGGAGTLVPFDGLRYGAGGGGGYPRGGTFAPTPFPNFPRSANNAGTAQRAFSGQFFYREPGFTQGGSWSQQANVGGGGGGGTYFSSAPAIWGGGQGGAGVILIYY